MANPYQIDPNHPDAPRQLADRAGTILIALNELGIRPLINPTDLLLISLLPMAIKKILTGRADPDAPQLMEILEKLDLTILKQLIYGDEPDHG